jgi:hypothetical protein
VGVLLAVLWTFTSYAFASRNGNVLLFSPLALCVAPMWIAAERGSARGARLLRIAWPVLLVLSIAAVVAHPLGISSQDNWRSIALVVPALLGCTLAFALHPVAACARAASLGADPVTLTKSLRRLPAFAPARFTRTSSPLTQRTSP